MTNGVTKPERTSADNRRGLRAEAIGTMRLLQTCPRLPVDVFAQLAGFASTSGAYKHFANLQRLGLAQSERADPGYLLCRRPIRLWRITDRGERVLQNVDAAHGVGLEADCQSDPTRSPQKQWRSGGNNVLAIAAYRLLAWIVAERNRLGDRVAVCSCERPFVRKVTYSSRGG